MNANKTAETSQKLSMQVKPDKSSGQSTRNCWNFPQITSELNHLGFVSGNV